MTTSTPPSKKRKISCENRGFNPDWEAYYFIERDGRPLCVICFETVSVMKEHNVKRHFETRHKEKSAIDKEERKEDCKRRVADIQRQASLFKKTIVATQTASFGNTVASYRVAYLAATNLKPFSEAEFVKDCMLAVADEVCPEKKSLFESVSLSATTLTRRVEEMTKDLFETLKERCRACRYFAIALDESTDIKHTSQLAIFFRGVTNDFDIYEEFVKLVPMKANTSGANVLAAVLSWMDDFGLDLTRLCGVTTDGAPAMTGSQKGFASLLVKHCRDLGYTQEIHTFHCIVHQEALCAKSSTLTGVMTVVTKAVNLVLSRALNHRQFKSLLEEADAEYGDLLYYSEVRWLSRGRMLQRAYELREELATFLESKGFSFPELRDPAWCWDFAFLVDLTGHLNTLNTSLQGKDLFVPDMISKVKAFRVKLMLWEVQLRGGNFSHFARLASLNPPKHVVGRYADVIEALKEEFVGRFKDFDASAQPLQLWSAPFDVDPTDVGSDLQMELIELNCDEQLKSRFVAMTPLDFWRSQARTLPRLTDNARRVAALFGSTYVCEQLFSRMKLVKSRTRAQLTDEHLQGALLLSVSSVLPDFHKLASAKQHQPSH